MIQILAYPWGDVYSGTGAMAQGPQGAISKTAAAHGSEAEALPGSFDGQQKSPGPRPVGPVLVLGTSSMP